VRAALIRSARPIWCRWSGTKALVAKYMELTAPNIRPARHNNPFLQSGHQRRGAAPLSFGGRGAKDCLELASGVAAATNTQPGDTLLFEPLDEARDAS